MAKLNARGRTEFARVAINGEDGTITKLALMSDRKVLISRSYISQPSGRRESSGWKVRGTLKREVTPETWLANKLTQGYTKIAR